MRWSSHLIRRGLPASSEAWPCCPLPSCLAYPLSIILPTLRFLIIDTTGVCLFYTNFVFLRFLHLKHSNHHQRLHLCHCPKHQVPPLACSPPHLSSPVSQSYLLVQTLGHIVHLLVGFLEHHFGRWFYLSSLHSSAVFH